MSYGTTSLAWRVRSVRTACIPFSEIPQTTRLFSTFLSDPEKLSEYRSHPPNLSGIAAAAREVKLAPDARRQLVDILRDQNARFSQGGKLDAAAARNLERLANGAVAVVTGQQVGLFSGPALTIYKALSALRIADEATRGGVDAVPVFWLATEDHDLAEINQSEWGTRNGLAKYQLPSDAALEGRCVGQISLDASVGALVQSAVETLEGACAAEISAALRESYTAGETFGSAFAELFARIFAGRGILLLDPQDARFDVFSAPVYRAAIEAAGELRGDLLARAHALEEAGYHAQVKVAQDSTLLFVNVDGRREPLRSRGANEFTAGSATFSRPELLRALDNTPEMFTASALLRPVLEDTILPTAALVCGPAEIAYVAQSHVVYRKLLGRMPAVLARASFTLIEPPIARFIEQYSLDFRDVLRGRQHLRSKMEQKAMPDDLANRFEKDEEALRKMMSGYRAPLERLDATLLGAVDSVEEKIIGGLQKLKEKVGRAENFRTGVLDRHERILLDALFADHELQERHLSFLPHLAMHGRQLLDDILGVMRVAGADAASVCAGQHHVLFLD